MSLGYFAKNFHTPFSHFFLAISPRFPYSYDVIDRVTGVDYLDSTSEAFTMDDLGNRRELFLPGLWQCDYSRWFGQCNLPDGL